MNRLTARLSLNRLSLRLSLAFLLTAWIGIGAMMLIVQRTLDDGFRHYVNQRTNVVSAEQEAQLLNYYSANGSWEGADALLTLGRGAGGSAGRGVMISIVSMDGIIIASTHRDLIGEVISGEWRVAAAPLTVNGTQVGWLYRDSPGTQALGAAEVAFLEQANHWLTLAGLSATVLALTIGLVFAWNLVRPLRALTNAARDLSVGQLGRQVEVRGTVEINALAAQFNSMSKALAEAESLRQRMAADVAHELRTPVSVLRGHLEAMLDGVYPLDSVHVAIAHDQTIHLARLVEDLRVLTLAESKRLPLELTMFDPAVLVTQMLDAFEPLALDGAVRLTRDIAPDLPMLAADITRIRQVFSNLLINAIRHTPEAGEIRVRVLQDKGKVSFSVTNTGAALTAEESAHVFQPFWRAATARERDSGGSGLGLAISREIVALHGGSMSITSAENYVTFAFTLPMP